MIVDTISPQAAIYHLQQFMRYVGEGHDETLAEEMADMDLIEWSKPIVIPEDVLAEVVQDDAWDI